MGRMQLVYAQRITLAEEKTMIGKQYKIKLPDDCDMKIIRQRVSNNGEKTDGFQDLLFKAYLISENDSPLESGNEYSPLYLWENNEGKNKSFSMDFMTIF